MRHFSGHSHNPLQTPCLYCLISSRHFPQNGHLQKSPHGMIFPPMDKALTTAPAKTPKRRKLTLQDAEAVASMVIGHKITEVEACLNLDINPDQWRVFKCRNANGTAFATTCTRMRGSEIIHSMQTIKNCGDGVGMKQPDWRAHAFRLGVIAPERFGAQAGTQAPGPAINSLTDDSMARLLSMLRSSHSPIAVVDCPSSVSTIKTITDVEAKA